MEGIRPLPILVPCGSLAHRGRDIGKRKRSSDRDSRSYDGRRSLARDWGYSDGRRSVSRWEASLRGYGRSRGAERLGAHGDRYFFKGDCLDSESTKLGADAET